MIIFDDVRLNNNARDCYQYTCDADIVHADSPGSSTTHFHLPQKHPPNVRGNIIRVKNNSVPRLKIT